MCAAYFIGSLVALTAAMAFFIQGVRIRQQYEDEEWRERIGDRR
jgi:hypothetical protein